MTTNIKNNITTLGIALTLLVLTCCESRQDREALYNAWCKFYGRSDISLSEWQMLRENYMLPGGEAKRAADNAAATTAMSAAAIGISASRR